MATPSLVLLALLSTALEDVPLRPGQRMQGRLTGGARRSYRLDLASGQALHCVALQRGIDLELRLAAPGAPQAAIVDSPNGNLGPEHLHWIASTAGAYVLELAAPGKSDPPGRYTLRCDTQRDASEAARSQAAGSAALFTGDRAAGGAAKRAAYQEAAQRFSAGSFEQAVAWHKLARVEGALGDRRRAIDTAKSALALYERLRERSSALAAEHVIGEQYGGLGEHAEALRRYERAARLARQIRNPRAEGTMLAAMAVSHVALSEYAPAQAVLERALPLQRKAADRVGEARTLGSLATALRLLGRFDEAIARGEEALRAARAAASPSAETQALNNLGVIEQVRGRYEQASRHFADAGQLATKQGDRRTADFAESNLGEIQTILYNYAAAIEHYRAALAGARRRNDRALERIALTGLARALRLAGQLTEARRAVDEAIELARKIKDREGEASALLQRAQLLETTATQDLEQSLAIRRALRDRRGEAHTLCWIGHARGPTRDALDPLYRCLATARSLGELSTEVFALTRLMRTANALGQPRVAVFYGKQAVNRLQELRANVQGLGSQAEQRFTEGRATAYRELAAILIAQGRLPEARQVLGLLKEEEYFDFLRRDPAVAPSVARRATLTDAELEAGREEGAATERLTALGSRRDALLKKLTRTRDEESELQTLDQRLAAAQAEFAATLDHLADNFAAKPQMVRLEQLREGQGMMDDLRDLPAGAAAIYTLVSPGKVHLVLVTAHAQKAYEREAPDLARRILGFRADLEDPRRDPKPAAAALGALLMPPELKADLAAGAVQTLMWSLDGPLRYLPAGALFDGERYLVESYRLAIFTPASQARLKDAPKKNWHVAGLGVSAAFGDLPALPQVPAELRGIVREKGSTAGILPGDLKLDQAFTRQALLDTRQHYPVLHIASHFHFQPARSAESYLLLGDGSRFSMQDLRAQTGLFSQVDLLTLSACNTGLGDGRGDGQEVESFAVLAQRQGAKAVVASLWSVADESTAELMKGFYAARETDHLTKAEALQRAQLALLRGEKQAWRHPFFWAPFFVVGNWQ